MKFRKGTYRRKGLPTVSGHMLSILDALRTHTSDEYPFAIMEIHPRTVQSLVRLDLMFESTDPHGGPTAYKLLPLGLHVLQQYERSERHFDGICPVCRARPKHVNSSGKRLSHCIECHRAYMAAYNRRYRKRKRDVMCANCGCQPRQLSRNGKQYCYCRDCLRQRRAQDHEIVHQRLLDRVAKGEKLICKTCGEREVSRSAKRVYRQCTQCSTQRIRRQRLARKLSHLSKSFAVVRGSDAAD